MQCSRREWTVEAVHMPTHTQSSRDREGGLWQKSLGPGVDATGETGGQTQVQVQVQVAGRCICGAGSAHAYLPTYRSTIPTQEAERWAPLDWIS